MNIIAYHGSPNNFDKFSFKKVGTESGTSGAGFGLYFSTSKADALTYGPYLYECMLDLETNVNNHKVDLTPTMLKAIISRIEEKYNKSYWENFGQNLLQKDKNKIISKLISDNDTDTEIIGDLINSLFGGNCSEILSILSEYGLTHTIDNKSPDDKTITHYIIYDLDSITIKKKEKIL
jgi:hypothetical protein